MTSEISTFLWNQWYFYLIYGHYNNSTLNCYLLVVGGGMLAVSADRLTVDTDTQALASAHSDPQPSVTDGFLACNWLNSPVCLTLNLMTFVHSILSTGCDLWNLVIEGH